MTREKPKNNYASFKKVKSKEDFFSDWVEENLKQMKQADLDKLYHNYTVKCKVFQRDGFKCQNTECKWPDSPLTFHHIKFQRNNGGWTERNGVTVCNTCHQAFHRCKRGLVFADTGYLPAHIRGHTFRETRDKKKDMKKLLVEMKALRKKLKYELKDTNDNIRLEYVVILLKWLEEDWDY